MNPHFFTALFTLLSFGSRFKVQGSGFKVQGSGFKVQGSRFKVQGSKGSKGSKGVVRRISSS